jgi:hypothetical protein
MTDVTLILSLLAINSATAAARLAVNGIFGSILSTSNLAAKFAGG